jgi:large subunit ribosomal protein L10
MKQELKREKPIPELKIKLVKELSDLIKNKKTILISSIKNLPASQFQEIGKKLRNKAVIKVPKKNLFLRAIDGLKDKDIEKIKEQFKDSNAILFSDLDAYELAGELLRNKSPAKAKPGQEAPMDIEIPAGPTDLVPGPAISELGAVGLQVQIEKGKISIREPKVIVKEGEKISQPAADIMAKLDIKPFSIGFIPLSAFDNSTKKLYLDIKINTEEAVEKLKEAYGKSLAFAVERGYASPETIKFLLGKAGMHEKALSNLVGKEQPKENKEEKTEEEKPEENKEESPAETTQTPEENKSEGEEK